MRISLVSMPWQVADWPSLALSTLDTLVTGMGHQVTQHHEHVDFAEYLLEATDGELTPDDYATVCESGYDHGVGEWIFTSALYSPGWREDAFVERLRREDYGAVTQAVRMHHLVPSYLGRAADRVLAAEPDLVGLTSTFEQNVPVLALATELKRRRPELPIVIGGANCDGVMGAALARNFSGVDYVVRGEGEQPLTELLDALAGRRELATVTSLCWRDPSGRMVENSYQRVTTPGALMPAANSRPYFARIESSIVRNWIDTLYLRLESSRGCWWGEKRQCTFCGLNGGSIAFRSKPAERVWAELEHAVTEYGVLDIAFSDNILDPAYIDSLLPHLAASDWDLRLFYEVKSNLKPEHMRALAEAGVTMVQPGIESLATGTLELMDKGVTGAGQVRALRLLREHGIYPFWNYLYGFPGEEWSRDYAHVVEQMPALVHLTPPHGVSRLTLDRFSPLFDRPELGIDEPRRAAGWYRVVYDLPDDELAELAYVFDYQPRGIDEATSGRILRAAIDTWRDGHDRSSLFAYAVGENLVISDRRVGWPTTDHVLSGADAAVYATLARHLTLPALNAALRAGDHTVDPDRLTALLDEWHRAGLVYRDVFRGEASWVALAMTADPRLRVSRLDHDVEDADAAVAG